MMLYNVSFLLFNYVLSPARLLLSQKDPAGLLLSLIMLCIYGIKYSFNRLGLNISFNRGISYRSASYQPDKSHRKEHKPICIRDWYLSDQQQPCVWSVIKAVDLSFNHNLLPFAACDSSFCPPVFLFYQTKTSRANKSLQKWKKEKLILKRRVWIWNSLLI